MTDDGTLSIIEGIEIPSIPHILQEILIVTNDPSSSSQDIEKLVMSEPGLVTHMLKTVNSAFFGTPREVRSVNHAIVMLGFSAVRSIVSGLVLIDVFHNLPGLDKKYVLKVWKHGLACAGLVRILANKTTNEKQDELYLTAMVQNVGHLVLAQHRPEQYAKLTRKTLFPSVEEEQEIFNTDHAETGAALLEAWKFPTPAIQLVKTHHDAELFTGDLFDYECLEIAEAMVLAQNIVPDILAADEEQNDPAFISKLNQIHWNWSEFQEQHHRILDALNFAGHVVQI